MALTLLYSWIVFLIYLNYTGGVLFCEVKTFDTVFNMGHLIYLFRCGQMWTYDPRLNGGAGGLMRDYSPLIASRQDFADDLISTYGQYSKKHFNITGFSFQDLSCANKDEDSRGKCKTSVKEWNHLTILMYNHRMCAYSYDTEYNRKQLGVGPLLNWPKHCHSCKGKQVNRLFPFLSEIAPEYTQFVDEKMSIEFGLFDSVRYFLYLAIKHDTYYCVTYLNMKKMLFNTQEWPINQDLSAKPDWTKANCFNGPMHGMFFLKNQAYIVGQVLYDNRVYDDQVYKMFANGQSRVEFRSINIRLENNASESQSVRRFFGCQGPKMPNIIRKKRSLQEPIISKRQKKKSLVKRVANNLLIQIMVSILVFALIYKLVGLQTKTRLQNKVFHKLF